MEINYYNALISWFSRVPRDKADQCNKCNIDDFKSPIYTLDMRLQILFFPYHRGAKMENQQILTVCQLTVIACDKIMSVMFC
jgi:hypothetical protein